MPGENTTVVSCVGDLLFGSKIRSAARAAGVDVRTVIAPPARIAEETAAARPHSVLIDLNAPHALEIVQALKADARTNAIPVVGFLSHVQTDLARAAVEAGCDRVMPRSEFSRDIDAILRGIAPPFREGT